MNADARLTVTGGTTIGGTVAALGIAAAAPSLTVIGGVVAGFGVFAALVFDWLA